MSDATKKAWKTPSARYVGQVNKLIQGGGGKLSNAPADPGEPRKPKPTNPES